MTEDTHTTFSGDKPLKNPEQDRLGYKSFAKHLAISICKMTPPEGLVLALYGEWGSGKSTVLKFVAHYLEQEKDNPPIVVDFNPWWFSGREDLTMFFFSELNALLSSDLKTIAKDIGDALSTLGRWASKVPLPGAEIGELVEDLFKDSRNVVDQKKKVAEALEKQEKRILIVIDDIDRLTAEEIRQLFGLIKSVADFPNVIYLLAFDKKVVTKALESAQGIPGEEYLEKIVQVPFELPMPDPVSLSKLFGERINDIIAGTPDELWDNTYWANMYHDGIRPFLKTPRDINRLINTLIVTYPAVIEEVNPVDFIAIETIRVFSPNVYDIVRKNKTEFVGRTASHIADPELMKLKSFHEAWMSGVSGIQMEATKQLLTRLFPILEDLERQKTDDNSRKTWREIARKQLRIYSPEIFDIYFRLDVPDNRISNAEMEAKLIWTVSGKTEDLPSRGISGLEMYLRGLAKLARSGRPSRLRVFLERMLDYVDEDISPQSIPAIVNMLYSIGDVLIIPEDEIPFLPFDGNEHRMRRVTWELLRRVNKAKRFEILQEAIDKSQSMCVLTHQIRHLGGEHGKWGQEGELEERRLLTQEQLLHLEQLYLDKLRGFAQDYSIFQSPKFRFTIELWDDLAETGEVKKWAQPIIGADSGLVTFLEQFLSEQYIYSRLTNIVPETRFGFDLKSIELYLNPSEIVDRVEHIAKNPAPLTDRQKIAVEQFLRAFYQRQGDEESDNDS